MLKAVSEAYQNSHRQSLLTYFQTDLQKKIRFFVKAYLGL